MGGGNGTGGGTQLFLFPAFRFSSSHIFLFFGLGYSRFGSGLVRRDAMGFWSTMRTRQPFTWVCLAWLLEVFLDWRVGIGPLNTYLLAHRETEVFRELTIW